MMVRGSVGVLAICAVTTSAATTPIPAANRTTDRTRRQPGVTFIRFPPGPHRGRNVAKFGAARGVTSVFAAAANLGAVKRTYLPVAAWLVGAGVFVMWVWIALRPLPAPHMARMSRIAGIFGLGITGLGPVSLV